MAKIAIPDNPEYKPEIEATTKDTPGSYTEFNPRFARLLENEAALKNAVNKLDRTATLAAGETSVVFSTEGIGEDDIIKFYAVDKQLDYNRIDIDKDAGQLTIFFDAQAEDVTIKMVVCNGNF